MAAGERHLISVCALVVDVVVWRGLLKDDQVLLGRSCKISAFQVLERRPLAHLPAMSIAAASFCTYYALGAGVRSTVKHVRVEPRSRQCRLSCHCTSVLTVSTYVLQPTASPEPPSISTFCSR